MYKKLITMLLSLAMVFTSCSFAFADTESNVTEEAVGAVPEATEDAVPNLLMVNFYEALEKAEAAREAAEKAAAEDAYAEEAAAEEASAEEAAKKADEAGQDSGTETAEGTESTEGTEGTEGTEITEDAEITQTPDTPEAVETEKEKAAREAAELYKEGLAAYMRKINTEMGRKWSLNLAQTFIDMGEKYNLDEKVLMALAQYESRFHSQATSRYGYKGMMQTSDWLAKNYGYKAKDLYDYEVSIDVAAHYLSSLKNSYKTYTKALSGYVYGGARIKSGNYSTKPAKKILENRDNIIKFLEKNDYITE